MKKQLRRMGAAISGWSAETPIAATFARSKEEFWVAMYELTSNVYLRAVGQVLGQIRQTAPICGTHAVKTGHQRIFDAIAAADAERARKAARLLLEVEWKEVVRHSSSPATSTRNAGRHLCWM